MTISTNEKSWWQKNRLWVVSGGCLAVLLLFLCIGAFVGMIFFTVTETFKSSEVYQQALEKARADPQVAQALGEPIEPGWMPGGSINVSGPSGDADLAIPISGPKNSGTIYIIAAKSMGTWEYSALEVEVNGQSERINLLR